MLLPLLAGGGRVGWPVLVSGLPPAISDIAASSDSEPSGSCTVSEAMALVAHRPVSDPLMPPRLKYLCRMANRMTGGSITRITMPLIARSTYIRWILMTIFCVNDFPTIFLLTGGGPTNSTMGP